MKPDDKQVKFIAEVSSNHHRDLDRCFEFVNTAAALGCYAVKFQLFRIDELFAPEILANSKTHRDRRQWELPAAFIPEIASRCWEKGIRFGCTPFFLEAVDILHPHVDFFKISSYELLWDALLARCAQTGKPVVLSTGMADLDEIEHAVSCLKENGCAAPVLLHCVSSYPSRPESCNLAAIGTLRDRFGLAVGWSDHSVSPATISRAVHHWNAEFVEFHLDLDAAGEEYSMGHCWLPHQIEDVIDAVNLGLSADGNGIKEPAPSEEKDRQWRADPKDGLRPRLALRNSRHGPHVPDMTAAASKQP